MKKISFVIVILLALMALAVQAAKRAAEDAPAVSVTVSPSDILAKDGDITAAVNAAVEGKNVKDILIFLGKNGQYTVSGSIVTAAPLTIKGNHAVIDASGFRPSSPTRRRRWWRRSSLTTPPLRCRRPTRTC